MNDKTEMPQEAARPKRKFGPSTVARLQVARIPSPSAISSMYSSIWTQSAA